MANFFNYNRESSKRESKGMKKQTKTNSFNERFTIYGNVLNSEMSQQNHQRSHKKIQMMKETLRSHEYNKSQFIVSDQKSIHELQKSYDPYHQSSYNRKLEVLKSNLLEIRNKSYHQEDQSNDSTKRWGNTSRQSGLNGRKQTKKMNKSTLCVQLFHDNGIQFYQHQSEELQVCQKQIKKLQASLPKEKSISRGKGKVNVQRSRKIKQEKSKKSLICTNLPLSMKKKQVSASRIGSENFVQKHHTLSQNIPSFNWKKSRKNESKGQILQTVSQKQLHRGKITEIIPHLENLYSSSLDYEVKVWDQLQGSSQRIWRHRGGVEAISFRGNQLYSCGRDLYLKYKDEMFRFDSCPKYLSPKTGTQMIVGCMNKIHTMDLYRCKSIREQPIQWPYSLHNRNNVSYIGNTFQLSIIDDRCPSMIQSLIQVPSYVQKWAIHPTKDQYLVYSSDSLSTFNSGQNQLAHLNLSPDESPENIMYNETGQIYFLTNTGSVKVWKPHQYSLTLEENSVASFMTMSQNLFYFGDDEGNITIKIKSC